MSSSGIRVNCRKVSAMVLCCILVHSPGFGLPAAPQEQKPLPEQVAEAAIQAEIRSYLEKFANQHPPVSGMKGFGSSAMFGVQLLLAADSYAHARNDKERFAAVQQGAAAYIAYAYAATPAVGLAVTAVILVSQIIQSGIASSYAESILSIYKDIMASEMRLADLKQRLGTAEALRFMALLDDTQKIVSSLRDVDQQISLNCRKPDDFATLSSCLTLMIQTVTLREQLLHAFDRILQLPDPMLSMLASEQDKKADPAHPGKEVRKRLTQTCKGAQDQLAAVRRAYGSFAAGYKTRAVEMLEREALEEPQTVAALEQVKHQCLVDQTQLSTAAAQLVYKSTLLRSAPASDDLKGAKASEARITDAALSLLENFEQRRLSCPAVESDQDLTALMEILRSRIERLPLHGE